jgi:NADH-quinone oxidoreductase subunit A
MPLEFKKIVMNPYSGIIFIFVFSVFLAFVFILLPKLLAPKVEEPQKKIPYESGEVPIGEAWSRYPVRFYLLVITFLIFEIEVLFVFPWAVKAKELGFIGFTELFIFVLILFLGWIWALKKGALKWE